MQLIHDSDMNINVKILNWLDLCVPSQNGKSVSLGKQGIAESAFWEKGSSIMKTKKAGFTLIELLVVIAVIAVLMAILAPALRRARESARRVVCASQCRQIGTAMRAYITDYGSKLPWYGDELHPYAVYRKDDNPDYKDADGEPLAMKFACLYEGKYISEPEVFYCPSNRIALYKYESYIVPEPPNTSYEWGTLPQKFNADDTPPHNQWVRIGYTYYPTSRLDKKNIFTKAPFHPTESWERLDERIPYMTDIIRKKRDLSHQIGNTYAVNALFKDGHVAYCNDQSVFNDPVWDELKAKQLEDELKPKFYYRIFKLIGLQQ